MEKFDINVTRTGERFGFQVVNKGADNPGGLDEEIIYLIADKIEAHLCNRLFEF
jgi:hypothetical protein